jgi:hypothetical protein
MDHVGNIAMVTVFPAAASILAFASPAARLADPLELCPVNSPFKMVLVRKMAF